MGAIGSVRSPHCSIAYRTAFTRVMRLCLWVSAAAIMPSCFSCRACITARMTTGSIKSTKGRDALSTQRRASRTSAGAVRGSGRGTTNAQSRSACRSNSSLGRPRSFRSIAWVIAHSASLVSLRVFAATCGQRISRWPSAETYELVKTVPWLVPAETDSSAAPSRTARTSAAPSSSASVLTSVALPAEVPLPARAAITVLPPLLRLGTPCVCDPELFMTSTTSLARGRFGPSLCGVGLRHPQRG